MTSSGNKRQHEAMMASVYASIHEDDDDIEATVLQGVATTVEEEEVFDLTSKKGLGEV
jgi:hypothetical protein